MTRFTLTASDLRRLLGCLLALAVFSAVSTRSSHAADATVLDTDMNADGLGFGKTDSFAFGAFGIDVGAVYHGNDIQVQTQATGSGSV